MLSRRRPGRADRSGYGRRPAPRRSCDAHVLHRRRALGGRHLRQRRRPRHRKGAARITMAAWRDPGKSATALQIAALLARLLVAGILIFAGFLKAVAPRAEFAAAIHAYQLFPSLV